jgi:hypothetical protein
MTKSTVSVAAMNFRMNWPRRETRLRKIREAKAALEERARQKANARAEKLKAEGRTPRKDPDEATPKPKDQRNFTDPESKIMKTSNKGFDQCGNAQAVANEDQILVSADVTDQTNDSQQVDPMVEQTVENLDAVGVEEEVGAFTADAGYFSKDNVESLEANDRIEEAYIATGRLKHHEQVPDAPKGRPPKNLTPKEKMARKLRTKKGRREYARRKAMVEPPFGQIKHCQGFSAIPTSWLEADARRMATGLPDAQSVETFPKRRVGDRLNRVHRGRSRLSRAYEPPASPRQPPRRLETISPQLPRRKALRTGFHIANEAHRVARYGTRTAS